MMQKQNRPDMDQAAKFLEKLDPKATSWTFQTFDDNAKRKDQSLARKLHGTLEEHAAAVADMQARGAGVYVTVNETDLKGRSVENITRVRAFFLDLDGAPLDPVTAWEEPHIICETSPGRYHTFWLVDDCPLDAFRQVQKDLIATFGGDKCIHDLPRVMRLPGFWHLKGDPYMVRMIETGASPASFTLSTFQSNINAMKPEPKLSQQAMPPHAPIKTGQGWVDTALHDELSKLLATPEGQRNDALNKAAFNLGQIVAGGALDEADVRARLTAAAGGIGLCAGEIAATIQSGLTAGLQTPRGPKEKAGQINVQGQIRPAADPVDLWGSFDPPELPQGLLPRLIEDFAHANGAQMGADPAGLAVAALVTCAAAIPDKIKIKVKRHADWTESARIWAAAMGPPSAKKSPIISAATGPLCKLDSEMMRAWQKKVQEYDALPPDEKKGRQRPPQTRLRLGDTTIEAAQGVMEGSPWGVLLLQDELSGFFGAMDKYNGGKGASADRAVWLQSYNGGEFSLNRVSRGAVLIENLSVCMLGGIQPEPMRKIAGDAVDDGLLQRLFVITLRNATMGTDEPMPPINADYSAMVRHLHKLKPPGWMGQGVLEFDDDAQAIRRDLEAKHLELQSVETINRKLASHIGKFDGVFARLCVLWHCIEHIESTMLCDTPDFDGTTLPATVTGATAQRVADFLHRFLLAHSIAFYSGVLGLSDDHDRLTAIAGHILAHKLDRITNRDVQRGDRTMRGLKDFEIRPLLEQLAALGWLDRIDPPRPSSAPHWHVNPAVHVRFEKRGKRENDRRRQARETIQSLAGAKT
ncbi:MAG: DUF3987 domain-containing protein [Yoonia sp.]